MRSIVQCELETELAAKGAAAAAASTDAAIGAAGGAGLQEEYAAGKASAVRHLQKEACVYTAGR